MGSLLSTEGLARLSGKYPWITIFVWIIALIIAFFITSNLLGDALTMEANPTYDIESYKGQKLLEKNMPDIDKVEEIIVIGSSLKVDDPEYKEFVDEIYKDITKLDEDIIEEAYSFYQTGDPSMVSKDKNTTTLPIVMTGELEEAMENIDKVNKIVEEADKDKDFEARIMGSATINKDFQETSEKDLQTGEFYGILIALLILIIVFTTLVSASIPIILAVVAIIAAVGLTSLLGQAFEFSFFIVNMITMMGLAVGIDYSLFIVSRFREERTKGIEIIEAIANSGASASKAVLFSGMTVILALIGMIVVPHTIFRSLATGAILVVISAVLASLTLLPAILRLLGDRVNSLRIPFLGRSVTKKEDEEKRGFWNWISGVVMRNPVISLVLTVGLLLAFAFPLLNINIGTSMGAASIPEGLPSKEAIKILEDKFSYGEMTMASIVIDGEIDTKSVQQGIKQFQKDVAKDNDFGPSNLIINDDKDFALLNVPILSESEYDKTADAVEELRDGYIPDAFSETDADIYVTGTAAGSIDFTKISQDYLPLVFVIILGLSFILLTLVFRSLVVPIKAIIMNLLSVGAAYGLMVLVFQEGIGADFFGFQQVDAIEAWVPLFLFSVLFGLSMDYHVFLLSRIRERFDQTDDNTESVAFGLRSTGRIITGAALIMFAVFAGFAAGDMIMFQQMGFGLAVAVIMDATIIRSILVPASMKLLGKRNWYLPKALQWLPDIHIEGRKEDI